MTNDNTHESELDIIYRKSNTKVFIEIPEIEIKEADEYRRRLIEIETEWIRDFNNNPGYVPKSSWNYEDDSRIDVFFGGEWQHIRLHCYDGLMEGGEEPKEYYRMRGILLRKHFGEEEVAESHKIADNLEEFLKKQKIFYKRFNFNE